jgi:uncharacterized membrane protein
MKTIMLNSLCELGVRRCYYQDRIQQSRSNTLFATV